MPRFGAGSSAIARAARRALTSSRLRLPPPQITEPSTSYERHSSSSSDNEVAEPTAILQE